MTARSPAEERKRPIPRWRRVGPLLVALVAAGALAAACSGGSHRAASSFSNAASAQSSARASGLLYASCIRAHGVPNYPDPPPGQPLGNARNFKTDPQIESAAQACQSDLPNPSGIPKKDVNPQQELTFARCMRAHGITDFPDPQSGGGFDIPANININSPQYAAAGDACGRSNGS
jgi:hypothetical protein